MNYLADNEVITVNTGIWGMISAQSATSGSSPAS
jgi:hypothetical protein